MFDAEADVALEAEMTLALVLAADFSRSNVISNGFSSEAMGMAEGKMRVELGVGASILFRLM